MNLTKHRLDLIGRTIHGSTSSKVILRCNHCVCTESPSGAFLTRYGPKEHSADHSVACCEKFARHFTGKSAQIPSNLDAVVHTGPVDVNMALA